MAGALQVSDFINFGKIVWDVYNYGWRKEYNAVAQYREFGRDVQGLAANLDILTRVVRNADYSLRRQSQLQAQLPAQLRWDPRSLNEIIGDYNSTLKECYELILTNERYIGASGRSGPGANIQWNILVQPQADRLRQRILMHNSKILHVLKPFEIDLLSRVRDDIRRMEEAIVNMHRGLSNQIEEFRVEIVGILTGNVGRAAKEKEERQIHFLDIPVPVAERFRQQSLADRPEYGFDVEPSLRDLTDAFILHFENSTVHFSPGLLIESQVPSVGQYLSLLKCVWLARQFHGSKLLAEAPPESHWPSYIAELEDGLSAQCARFSRELTAPNVVGLQLAPVMYSIWPEREKPQLVDVVTRDELMEEILEVPQVSHGNVQRKIQLHRRLGSDGRRFRITIYGTEQTVTGKPNSRAEVIDFDLSSIVINPLYAIPTVARPGVYDMILRKDERIATLQFTSLKSVLKFQNAITGYKPWQWFSQYNAKVTFVVSGKSVEEIACIQLWVPKPMDGKIVKGTEVTPDALTAQSRSGSIAAPASSYVSNASAPMGPGGSVYPIADSFGRTPDRSPPAFDPLPRSYTSPSQPGYDGMGSGWHVPMVHSPQPMHSPNPGVHSPSSRYGTSPTSPFAPSPSNFHAPYFSPTGTGALAPGWPTPPPSASPTPASRQQHRGSIASNMSTQTATNSSSSDTHTVTISVGRSTGYYYEQPSTPQLVLFTQSPSTGALSLVTIDLDDRTLPNPERCNCRRAGDAGTFCTQAAIERAEGREYLEVRRYDTIPQPGSNGADLDWNLARLAQARPEDDAKAVWQGVRRVTIDFPTHRERAAFVGTPNQCRCNVRLVGELRTCLGKGHRGMMGEVMEFDRRLRIGAYTERNANRQEVVRGQRED